MAHRFGCGPLKAGEAPPTARVFKHRLLQHFMLSLFCKLPVQPMTRIRDMRAAFMVRPCPQLHKLSAGQAQGLYVHRNTPDKSTACIAFKHASYLCRVSCQSRYLFAMEVLA